MNAHDVELRDVFCVHRTAQGDAAALQGLNLTLAAGELLAVLGPSGAGKSTLLRVIAGLQLPQAGIVGVLGRDIGGLPARARAEIRHGSLGFLSQRSDSALSPDLRARSAIALPLAMRGVDKRACDRRVSELLDATGLTAAAAALPGELSGGERQRLALCVALAHRPALLLADEPTGELDEHAAAEARELIARLVRQEGAGAIVVSHDPRTAAIADRSIRLRDGRVVAEERDGDHALVVDERGWLRLPDDLLATAGIHGRVRARAEPDRLALSPAGAAGPSGSPGPRLAPGAAGSAGVEFGRAEPARVELQLVSHGYRQGRGRRLVLDGFSRAFPPARVTVVAGPSGSGKTTLLRLLAALEHPLDGKVMLDGEPLAALDSEGLAALRRDRIGYLSQEPSPVGFLSGLENVILVLRIRGWDPAGAAAQASRVLAAVGLEERRAQRLNRLSAGEAQRVALARALAAARGLLVVDEPTSRLDEAGARVVAALLRGAAAEGQTVICATHDPLVIAAADEILKLGAAAGRAASATGQTGAQPPGG